MRKQGQLANRASNSGLAWHTEEGTLRQKFEEFGAVEEAVSPTPFPRCLTCSLSRLGLSAA